jgi:hypothetical protein
MTAEEFARVLCYLQCAVNKDVPRMQAEVYFDLLKDLPAEAVECAARQALLESDYPVLPPVGKLRRLALDALAGPEQMGAYEAFALALQAVRRYGLDREREALASLPPLVAKAVECIGWRSLCDATELDTLRAQFRDAYGILDGRERRERLMPPELRRALEGLGKPPAGLLESDPSPDGRGPWRPVLADAEGIG